MFGQIYFRVLGIGCFLSMALLSSAQSKLGVSSFLVGIRI